MEVINRFIALKSHVEGAPRESDFELKTEAISLMVEPHSNCIILKNLYVSIDPYQMNRMKSYSSSHKAVDSSAGIVPGQAIEAQGIAKVVASGNPDYEKDHLVVGFISWGEYTVTKSPASLAKLDPLGFPLSYHLSILGSSGLTAYAGFFDICKPRKGEKVFVSAACGSVGNLVGQYAKLFGCYVVGCAGSKEKVALLKDKLGFDDAFNYKEQTDLKSTLKRYFPDGIDIYFDNVGSEMLEAAITNMNNFGRISACGAISEYTNMERKPTIDMIDIVYKRIKMQGFLMPDHLNLHSEFMSTTCVYIRNGKIQILEDVSNGVESIPSSFIGLFSGDNVGKKMVKLFEED
ncbi:2-alkenal reductase (NADP(+)-dependent)-like [Mercurialis annua]|uniref:2-alkenal reductase (NADP(+)-dependent)-like n=1 Tax=Mercurialis annua TaxID=3986 RepID=UPI00215FB254|nr:2-alkenal reductase (NADP(+)-dependent)-like [Mercurialis annua]XP_050212026.1 2-alkenal reductase (NADP(+)-dependent)-like [Mercurialis annua]XP_055960296.1 2-alkenal reductase (NADP(+)-dependent)-like [Mercurialis annua]